MFHRFWSCTKLTLISAVALLSAFPATATAQDAVFTVGEPLPRAISGMSAEYDPHFLTQNLGVTPGIRAWDWNNIVLRRIKLLKLQRLRVMVLPSWYEPQNDNDDPQTTNESGFNFASPEFLALEKLLNFCQANDIKTTLVFWGTPSGSFMLPEKGNGWLFGPSRYEEWAENVSRCVKYLVKERKYKCIEAFTPVNEPDWAWIPTNVPNVEKYIAMCRVMQKRLEQDGLRKKIRLNLSDNSDGGSNTFFFLDSCARRLTKESDFLNSHTYIFGYETPDSVIFNWERENVRISGNKPHFVGEFGSNQTVGSTRQRDINRFERGILMARIVINCLNAGASGLSYWSLFDQYYSRGEAEGKQYGQMQQLGLWKYLKEAYAADTAYHDVKTNYEPRPQYYALGLLTRFIRRGDKVMRSTASANAGLSVLALRSAKKELTYIIANPTQEPLQCSISCGDRRMANTFRVYNYLQGKLPEDDSMIEPEKQIAVAAQRGKTYMLARKIPANCLMVITQRDDR